MELKIELNDWTSTPMVNIPTNSVNKKIGKIELDPNEIVDVIGKFRSNALKLEEQKISQYKIKWILQGKVFSEKIMYQ